MMLHWTRNEEPGMYLYEMIQINDADDRRSRVWQWFRDGALIQRTLIDEQRKSNDWRSLEQEDPRYEELCQIA